MLGTIFVVLSQLPAVGIGYAWFQRGTPLAELRWSGLTLLGFFAPPFLIAGWVVALFTLVMSPQARKSIPLWLALALGGSGITIYDSVIGHF